MFEIVVMCVVVFVIWGGSEIGMYLVRRNKYIDLSHHMSGVLVHQTCEDAIENAIKLRKEMTKNGYIYVGGEFITHPKLDECTGWCMYSRRLDNHVRRFVLVHGVWIEQVVEGTQSELEQIP